MRNRNSVKNRITHNHMERDQGEREVQARLMSEQKLSKEEIKIIAYSKRRKFETSRRT